MIGIRIRCDKCGKHLGTYKGDEFVIYGKAASEVSIVCKARWEVLQAFKPLLAKAERQAKTAAAKRKGLVFQPEA